jgi:ketosteroid isomerase-like protein
MRCYHPCMHKTRIFLLGFMLLSSMYRLRAEEDSAKTIKGILNQEAIDWNQADLVKFVAPYADQCVIMSGNQISETSRAQVLAHYQQKYPSHAAMGKLTFSELTVRPIGQESAFVTGRWHLDREKSAGGPVGGIFSLVFRKIEGRWQIVLDHTS